MKYSGSGKSKKTTIDHDIQIVLSNLNILKDELRITILNILQKQESKGLSFSSISKETSIRPTTLAYHLKVLKKAGLVEKGFKQASEERDYTCYTITEKGSSVFSFREIVKMGTDQVQKGIHPGDIPVSIKVIPMSSGSMIIDITEMI